MLFNLRDFCVRQGAVWWEAWQDKQIDGIPKCIEMPALIKGKPDLMTSKRNRYHSGCPL